MYVAFAELELRTNKCKPAPLLPGIVTDLGLVKNLWFPAMRFLQSSRLTSIHPFSDQLWHLLALLQGFRGGFRTGHHQKVVPDWIAKLVNYCRSTGFLAAISMVHGVYTSLSQTTRGHLPIIRWPCKILEEVEIQTWILPLFPTKA